MNIFNPNKSYFIVCLVFAILVVFCRTVPARGGETHHMEILRDDFAIPHVFANSIEGAYYGMGWAVAEDEAPRIYMEIFSARGMLAEYLHAATDALDISLVDKDITARALGYYEHAAQWMIMAEEVRTALCAFVNGFNDFIARADASGELDGRFKSPREGVVYADVIRAYGPITPRDIVAMGIMANASEALSNLSDEERDTAQKLFGYTMGGSNAAAISGFITDDGTPILYGDSHNNWVDNQPMIHLDAPGLQAVIKIYGPYVLGGYMNHLAIAPTRNYVDGADVYKEKISPERRGEYRYDHEWHPMTRKKITLKVRYQQQIEIDLFYSHHGWLWDYPPRNPKATQAHSLRLAVLDTMYDPYVPVKYVSQWMRMFRSESVPALYSISRTPYFAFRNIVAADDANNIAYLFMGRIPVRSGDVNPQYKYDYEKPLDGANPWTDWMGGVWTLGHPDFQLPSYLNPVGGNVRSANDAPWRAAGCEKNAARPPGLPAHVVPMDMVESSRGRVLREVLCSRRVRNLQDVKNELAFNTLSPDSRDFMAALENGRQRYQKQISELDLPDEVKTLDRILRDWNYHADVDQPGMTVMFHLRRNTLLPWFEAEYVPTPVEMLTYFRDLNTVAEAMKRLYGRLDVPWGQVHVMIQNGQEVPIPGGTGNISTLLIAHMGMVKDQEFGMDRDMMYGDLKTHTEKKYLGKILCNFGSLMIQAFVLHKSGPEAWVISPHGQLDPKLFPDSGHLMKQTLLFSQKKWMHVPLSREDVEKQLCTWCEEPGTNVKIKTVLDVQEPAKCLDSWKEQ